MDKKKIEKAVRDILEAIGENPDRPELQGTPCRVAEMYEEIFCGIGKDPIEEIKILPEASVDEINLAYREAAETYLKNILDISEEELVSMDFKGNPASAIVDLPLTMANGNLVKVVGWYDNEWGYANRLVEMAELAGNILKI